MDYIKLRSKKTGIIHECDIYLSNYPQIVEVQIKNAEGFGYDSFEQLAKDWEIVSNKELKEGE